MNKQEACKLLDVNLRHLAEIIGIGYDSLRSLKELSATHIKLISWELDKRYIDAVYGCEGDLKDVGDAHKSKVNELNKIIRKAHLKSEIERAKDN